MTITEPMTLITDYLLGAWVWYLGMCLVRVPGGAGKKGRRLFAGALAAVGLAAFAGGTVHGLQQLLPAALLALLWKLTVFAVGIGGYLLVAALVRAVFAPPWRRLLLLLVTVKLVAYLGWMSVHDAFRYVIYDYAPSLVALLLLALYLELKRREAAGRWLAAGVLVCFIGAAIQMSGLALHPHFNHNDLYHVVQMIAFYLLYRGGLLLPAPR